MNRPRRRRHRGQWYEIRVRGHMDHRWADWLDGLDIVQTRDGTTVLHGCVADQAALHSILQRLRDIGSPHVSLTQVEPSCLTTAHPSPPRPGTSSQ